MDQDTKKAVIATLAADRPGIVSELAELVHGLGLNIEDSRMTVLGGDFAVLMSVAGGEAALGQLEDELAARTTGAGFAYLFRRTEDKPAGTTPGLKVTVAAMDHPGIVAGVASFFSQRGVNIRELSTETTRAAHTGAPVFNLTMDIEPPTAVSVEELYGAFQAFGERENLDGAMNEP